MTDQTLMVIGAGGQLGRAMVERCAGAAAVHAYTRQDLDAGDARAVASEVERVKPTLLINCSAFTDVDGAETRPLAAFRVNAEAVWCLARLAREFDAVLVHYSTEFVYDGTLGRPYVEDDEPGPQSVYGISKLAGEFNYGTHPILDLSGLPEGSALVARMSARASRRYSVHRVGVRALLGSLRISNRTCSEVC